MKEPNKISVGITALLVSGVSECCHQRRLIVGQTAAFSGNIQSGVVIYFTVTIRDFQFCLQY